MTSDTTLIRVPLVVRDRVRILAGQRRQTYGQLIELGLDLIEQDQFWNQVAALQPDQAYRTELADWDSMDLSDDNANH